MNVGARVKAIRIERGMTTTELVAKVGISQAQISRLEHGLQGWRSITLQKVADALDVSVGFLYADEKTDEAISLALKYRPELKKILRSPMLSDLTLKVASLRQANPKAFRAVKTLVEQLTN